MLKISILAPRKRIALIAALALGSSLTSLGASFANPGAPGFQPPSPGMEQPGGPQQDNGQNDVQQVLARYGQFMKHEKYGDVWKPTQVAQGWRPYEPCNWVFNQEMKAWFYDDKSEWGAIVHHYGRWTLDQQQGWLWVPGGEFGPGWVSWEMRGNEVGWAPLPPEQDGAIVESAAFKNDPNLWIFVAFNSLGKGCGGMAPPPPQPRAMMEPPPAPQPGGYVSGGYVTGGIVTGGVIIVSACRSHPRWCHYWPGRHWHWPKPHHHHAHNPGHGHGPHHPGGHHPGGHHPGGKPGGQNGGKPCVAAWCNPNNNAGNQPGGNQPGGKPPGGNHPGGNQPGGKPPGPDQQCGIAGQFCKGPIVNRFPRPNQQVWNNHRPHVNQIAPRPYFPNRHVNPPRFNNRLVMNQPRINHRPMHFQQRSMAPRMNAMPRMNAAPRMAGPRIASGPMRRR